MINVRYYVGEVYVCVDFTGDKLQIGTADTLVTYTYEKATNNYLCINER